MLGGGSLSRQVLSSCAALSRYACSCRASQVLQPSAIAAYRRSSGSLISWQIQHAQQSTLQSRPGCAAPRLSPRSRGICISVSCKADSPKTVRDIVRELKKGECPPYPFIAVYRDYIVTPQQGDVGHEEDLSTLLKEHILAQVLMFVSGRGCHHYICQEWRCWRPECEQGQHQGGHAPERHPVRMDLRRPKGRAATFGKLYCSARCPPCHCMLQGLCHAPATCLKALNVSWNDAAGVAVEQQTSRCAKL